MAKRGKLPFCPRSDGTPRENVAAFIAFGRDRARAFGAGLDFDANSWKVTGQFPVRKGRPASPRTKILNFGLPRGMGEELRPLSDLTQDICKAYVRSARSLGLTYDPLRMRAYAWGYLDEALNAEGAASVCDCNGAILDHAVRLARARLGPGAENIACQHRTIARFLDRNGMTTVRVGRWMPTSSVPAEPERGSDEFEARSEARLPSAEFLSAVTTAFGPARHPMDIVALGAYVLALGYSARINEVLALEADCARWIVDKSGRRHLRIASPGSKLKPAVVRYVATDLTDAVQAALERMTAVTAEARLIKKWYDVNDSELYLPPHLEHLRGRTDLSHAEAGELLGITPRSAQDARSALLPLHDVPMPGARRTARTWRFKDLEELILRRLPRSRMEVGGARDPLFIVNAGAMRGYDQGTSCPCMYAGVAYYQIAASLGMEGRKDRSVFTRMGLDPEKRITGRAHSARHLNHSLLASGGISEIDAALYAGRGDPRQNRSYDHAPLESFLGNTVLPDDDEDPT